jgi:cobyrinic acid a,c-diamide synthase
VNKSRGIVVAGTGSHTGKTSLVCGLLVALRRRGILVRAAKCGPDYLDPMWLSRASGRPCPNLDPWMAGPEGVRQLAQGEGTLIVEGAMGLYDGICPDSDEGSAAEVARILGLPVLLVVDASGSARTAAAVVQGMRDFGAMEIAGVVANRVGSAHHAVLIGEALSSRGLPPLLGYLPKDAFPSLPERHLGLVPPEGDGATVLAAMGEAVAATVDLEALLSRCAPLPELPAMRPPAATGAGLRLGLSWDEAFCFAYEPIVAALAARGVEIVRFSPLSDKFLPENLDGLWLCGGYPELHAQRLSENRSLRDSVATFCAGGAPVLAECGGMLFLAREIVDLNGKAFPMCGVVPAACRMERRLRSLGYRTGTAAEELFVAGRGERLRGHEFHYGELQGDWQGAWRPAFSLENFRREAVPEGWWNGSVLATWLHAWLLGSDATLERWIGAMRARRERRM